MNNLVKRDLIPDCYLVLFFISALLFYSAPALALHADYSKFREVMKDSQNPSLNSDMTPLYTYNTKQNQAKSCGYCHDTQLKEWRKSNHAMAAKAPVYNWFELKINLLNGGALRTNGSLPNLCVRCHAPAAAYDQRVTNPNRTVIAQLAEKAKEKKIGDDEGVVDELAEIMLKKLPFPPLHQLGTEGVTCMACHSPLLDHASDMELLKKVQFQHGTNMMSYDLSTNAVRTGRYAASGSFEARTLPIADSHKFGQHPIIVEDEISNTSVLNNEKDMPFKDGFSGGGAGKGDSGGVCRHCHQVQTRAHVDPDEDPLEQMSASEWRESDAFKRGESCVDCHMINTQKGKPRIGDFSRYSAEKRYKNIPGADHSTPGGANILMSDRLSKEEKYPYKLLANKKVEMLRSTIDFQVLLRPDDDNDSDSCNEDTNTVGVRVENTRRGHNVPTGFTQFRQLWVEASVECNGKKIFSSGHVKTPYDLLGGHAITFERYSNVKSINEGSRDFYFPVVSSEGDDKHLIHFIDNFLYKPLHMGGKPVMDFAGAVVFSKFVGGHVNDSGARGPIGSSSKKGKASPVKTIYYPEIDMSQCGGKPATGNFNLNWRFYPAWLLMDLRKNIEAGRSEKNVGFPEEAIADIDAGRVDPIDDEAIKKNIVYTLYTIENFTIPPKKCR